MHFPRHCCHHTPAPWSLLAVAEPLNPAPVSSVPSSSTIALTSPPIFGLWATVQRDQARRTPNPFYPFAHWHLLLIVLRSSSPDHSEAVLSHTQNLDLCHSPICASILCDYGDPLSYSLLFYSSTSSFSSTRTHVPMSPVQHFRLRTPVPSPSSYFQQPFQFRKGSFIVFQMALAVAVLVQWACTVSSTILLIL